MGEHVHRELRAALRILTCELMYQNLALFNGQFAASMSAVILYERIISTLYFIFIFFLNQIVIGAEGKMPYSTNSTKI